MKKSTLRGAKEFKNFRGSMSRDSISLGRSASLALDSFFEVLATGSGTFGGGDAIASVSALEGVFAFLFFRVALEPDKQSTNTLQIESGMIVRNKHKNPETLT